jgi:hypothetical protein
MQACNYLLRAYIYRLHRRFDADQPAGNGLVDDFKSRRSGRSKRFSSHKTRAAVTIPQPLLFHKEDNMNLKALAEKI